MMLFVLTSTVVSMEVDVLAKVVEHAPHYIGSLTRVNCLINEVVDLAW